MKTKTMPKAVPPPNLQPDESAAVLLAVQLEVRRYKDIPMEDLTSDVRDLEKARHKLWHMKTFIGDKEMKSLPLEPNEWRACFLAVNLELERYRRLTKDQWTPDVFALERASGRIERYLAERTL